MCEEADIKEMGLPMGPRKKLQGYLKEQKLKQVESGLASLHLSVYSIFILQ